MTKLSKFLSLGLYILLAITVVFGGMFFFGGDIVGEAYFTPKYTEAFLNWGKTLVVATIVITILFELLNIIIHPKNAVRSLISFAILAVIVLISYGMSDSTPLNLSGYDGPDNVASMLTMSGTFLYGTYILLGVAFAAILVTELSRMFK